MGRESKPGRITRNTKVSGEMIKLTEEVFCIMRTVTFTMVNGLTIKQMEKAHTSMPMELNTSDSGKMTSSVDMGEKLGPIMHCMRATTSMERSMAAAS